MKLLLETLIWLLVIQVFVTLHFWIIEWRKKSPRHFISWLVCFGLACVVSQVVFDMLTLQIINVIYLGLLYWILFPLQLNLFRKKPLLYIGHEEQKHDLSNGHRLINITAGSFLDSLERRLENPGLTLVLKIILLVLSGICLVTI